MQPKIKLLMLAILLATANIFAQTAVSDADKTLTNQPHRAQVIYGELLGNGIVFSANYDFRFTKSQKGFGMRLGLGFFGVSGSGIITVPVGINHLAGKAPDYFESGIGITYAKFTGTDFFSGSGSWLVPSIGYRYQPEHNGFFWRIAISPLISLEKGDGWISWGGIGLGYKF